MRLIYVQSACAAFFGRMQKLHLYDRETECYNEDVFQGEVS